MSSRKQEINIQLNQLLDALLLGVLLYICYVLRASGFIIIDSLHDIPEFPYMYWMLAILMPFGPFFLEMQGFYQNPVEKSVARSLEQIVRAGIWVVILLGVAAFLLRLTIPSRSVLVLYVVLAPVVLLIKDRVRYWLHYRRLEQGGAGEPIILAGEREEMERFEAEMTPAQRLEMRVVERVDLSVGEMGGLVDALHRHSVGRVILSFRNMDLESVQRAVETCEVEGVEAWLNANIVRTSVARPVFETLGRKPMLVFRATPEVSWALMWKSVMDRVGAMGLIIALSPLLLLVAVAVRLSSPGPAIFRQRRAGLYGRPFTMLKFRTMCMDAEDRQRELETLNEMSGPVFKIENDPRITRLGRFLRRTSIDELPQLFNVLRGEMSLVGPRPLPLYEVEKFESAGHRRRLSMKPGLTCLWQVRGRNQVTEFDDWVRMDLEYIDNWSIWLDLVILFRTVPAVIFGFGAK
jgi:exopolysaccharide biosynthesis polyprenyl glycosylphosphotransferase